MDDSLALFVGAGQQATLQPETVSSFHLFSISLRQLMEQSQEVLKVHVSGFLLSKVELKEVQQ